MKYFVRFSQGIGKEIVTSSVILEMSFQDLDHGIPRIAELIKEKLSLIKSPIDIIQLNSL